MFPFRYSVFMGSTVTDLKVAGSPLYSQGDGGSGNPMVNYNISWSVLSGKREIL